MFLRFIILFLNFLEMWLILIMRLLARSDFLTSEIQGRGKPFHKATYPSVILNAW